MEFINLDVSRLADFEIEPNFLKKVIILPCNYYKCYNPQRLLDPEISALWQLARGTTWPGLPYMYNLNSGICYQMRGGDESSGRESVMFFAEHPDLNDPG